MGAGYGPLIVLDDLRDTDVRLVRSVDHDRADGGRGVDPAREIAALAGYDEQALGAADADGNRLQQAVCPDRSGAFVKLPVVERFSRLVGIGLDLLDRNVLHGGFGAVRDDRIGDAAGESERAGGRSVGGDRAHPPRRHRSGTKIP